VQEAFKLLGFGSRKLATQPDGLRRPTDGRAGRGLPSSLFFFAAQERKPAAPPSPFIS